MKIGVLLIGFLSLLLEVQSFGNYFNFNHPNLRYYETISAKTLRHRIVKRGLQYSTNKLNHIKEIEFSAMGRPFHLILNQRKGLLHPYFNAYSVDGKGKETRIEIDHDQFFEGRVFGENQSEVTAHLEDGKLTATIHTEDESYYIEPSWRHIPDSDPDDLLVYRASDVQHSWDDPSLPDQHKMLDYVKEGNDTDDDLYNDWDDYFSRYGHGNESLNRVKRQQSEPYNFNGEKTKCPLLLVADYRFFKEMGGSVYKNTVNYLISLIDRVKKIYENTEWRDASDSGGFRGMGFAIKKILVHQEWTPVASSQVHYNMKKDSWDVRNLLEVFSREYSHKDYCLAHLFTDIKFEGGILGLAYVGSPRRNSVGGICTPEYFKNGHTLYLNSGLSSSRNHYGQRVITREADLVTAHEFGHNWGSEHDPDRPECSPGASQGGSYLMYTYSVSGYDINNKKFSPCSLRAIRAVLIAKSSRCFTEPAESYCGNQRVEGEEECDAGLVGQNDVDSCCDKNCKLRSSAMCSDKNSPCCHSCHYMQANQKCREEQRATCEKVSRCTGDSATCPKAESMPDGTPCIEKGQCRDGKCLPFCETKNMQSCMCDTINNACKRCCRNNLNETCFPIDPVDILPNGTPCIHGFCNDGKCEKTVQDVVERFWDIIEDINMNTVLQFLTDNIVGTVLIISVLIWLPASCVFSLIDRKVRSNHQKYVRWYYSNELIHPNDSVKVIVSKRTRVATNHSVDNVRHRPEGAETRPVNTPHCNPPHSHHFASPL